MFFKVSQNEVNLMFFERGKGGISAVQSQSHVLAQACEGQT